MAGTKAHTTKSRVNKKYSTTARKVAAAKGKAKLVQSLPVDEDDDVKSMPEPPPYEPTSGSTPLMRKRSARLASKASTSTSSASSSSSAGPSLSVGLTSTVTTFTSSTATSATATATLTTTNASTKVDSNLMTRYQKQNIKLKAQCLMLQAFMPTTQITTSNKPFLSSPVLVHPPYHVIATTDQPNNIAVFRFSPPSSVPCNALCPAEEGTGGRKSHETRCKFNPNHLPSNVAGLWPHPGLLPTLTFNFGPAVPAPNTTLPAIPVPETPSPELPSASTLSPGGVLQSPPTVASPPPSPSPPAPAPAPTPPPPTHPMPKVYRVHPNSNEFIAQHPYLQGLPCSSTGKSVDGPPKVPEVDVTDFYPFRDFHDFYLARWAYRRAQISGSNFNELMEILAEMFRGQSVPWANIQELFDTVDAIEHGGVPWTESVAFYDGEVPPDAPTWMTKEYTFFFRDPLKVMEDQLANPGFAGHIDYAPKRMFRTRKRAGKRRQLKRRFRDVMSGDWAWEQADILAQDHANHGAMFAPIVLGSDKTTVSVATGHNEYHPLYASLGNLQNHARRSHRDGVSVIGFLAIPKTDHENEECPEFRRFRRQLMHSCLVRILSPLEPWMTTPRVALCADGHYRRVIYGIGPYIADYPEHCMVAGIVYGYCPKCTSSRNDLDDPGGIPRSRTHTNLVFEAAGGGLRELWDDHGIIADVEVFTMPFPRADIHELLTPDLLHQVIKGVFKDHLVKWILQWIDQQKDGQALLDEFDKRIAVAPSFPALRRFPEGRNFKQWTGNDSKALMKVILPAIDGLVPEGMVRTISTFLEICYIVRRDVLEESDLNKLDKLVDDFHREREVFRREGIRANFNLPRQHSLVHYSHMIRRFGAPNGLCSSITESKHIEAVKETYRRSNLNQPMGQMLRMTHRIAQMEALEQFYLKHDMIARPFRAPLVPDAIVTPAPVVHDENLDFEEVTDTAFESLKGLSLVTLPNRPDATTYHRTLFYLEQELGVPGFRDHIRRFLFDELNIDSPISGWDIELAQCPWVHPNTHVKIYHRARVSYISPSEPNNLRGLQQEFVRAIPEWDGHSHGRYDCVYLYNHSKERPGFAGLHVAQVHMFFSFETPTQIYPCALVRWFVPVDTQPCPNTRMWKVKPLLDDKKKPVYSVEHVQSIVRGAHLMGIYGQHHLPRELSFDLSLHAFNEYYVNKFIDRHAHEIAF